MSALEQRAELQRAADEARKVADEAILERNRSDRALPRAQGELTDYLLAVEAGERARDAKLERRLRDAVAEAEALRVEIERRGTVIRYADARAVRRAQDAIDAADLAAGDVARFEIEHEAELESEMLERAEQARDRLTEALEGCGAAWTHWYAVRRDWVALLERWGRSPADLPRLPIQDPQAIFDEERARQERELRIVREPAGLVPAPRSVVTGEAPTDGGEMRALTREDLVRREFEAA